MIPMLMLMGTIEGGAGEKQEFWRMRTTSSAFRLFPLSSLANLHTLHNIAALNPKSCLHAARVGR
jgi:hypothetical protein